jgi:hypothetical protein
MIRVQSETADDDDDNHHTDNDEYDENTDGVRLYGREHFGEIACANLTPYLYNCHYMDKVFGIRKSGDSTYMIGDMSVTVDEKSSIIVQSRCLRGVKGYGSC